MPRSEPIDTELLTPEALSETAREIEGNIVKAYGPVERWIPQSNAASRCGHPCPFYLWAMRARPMDLAAPWDGLAGIFKLGKEVERAVVRDIEDAGYEVTNEQVRFRDEKYDITGYIDGYLRQRGHAILGDHVPLEIKGLSPNNFDDAKDFASMLSANYYILRMVPAQILMYAHMAPEERPLVALAVRNKSNRQTRIILERAADWTHVIDGVHEVLEQVNHHLAIQAGGGETSGPDPMPYDPVWCDGCDAKAICPNMERLQGAGTVEVRVSPELDTAVSTMLDLEVNSKAYNRAKAKVKKYAEGLGLYGEAEVGAMRTVVTQQHRVTVEHKSNGRYLTVVPLLADDGESEETEDAT